MSAYLNLPVQISTMVCRTCGTESFAWLAEIFVCPICGDCDYVFRTSAADIDRESAAGEEEADEETPDTIVKLNNMGKKRKRSVSSDGNDAQ